MPALKVLIIGPSTTRSRGGMATVISNLLQEESRRDDVELMHLVTHVEGSAFDKVVVLIKALLQVLFLRSFDLMHIHVASDISIFRKSIFVHLASLLKKPVVIHVHGADFDVYFNRASSLKKKYILGTFSRCAKVLVLSTYWKSFFEQHIPHKDIEVVHNGVCVEDFQECATVPLNLKRFLFLGRLCQRKGVYDLLEAIRVLVKQRQLRELRFYLAGDGELEQVQELIHKHDLAEQVEVLGWLDEAERKQWLSQVDTVILPSYSEGLPMAILEAMAGGKIIISSYTGGIPEVVTEENGFLILPGDVQGLCNHIEYVYTHPGHMAKISVNNMRKVEQLYNLSDVNERVLEICHESAGIRYAQVTKKEEVSI